MPLSFGRAVRYMQRGGSWSYILWGAGVKWFDCSIGGQRSDYMGLRLTRRTT